MKAIAPIVIVVTALAMPPMARALCIYNGTGNAKTTIPAEFKAARWVVKAKVQSAKDHWSDAANSWTTYEIQVEHVFKGNPAKQFKFFTFRDSGGFYMDRPWVKLPQGHDIGGEYLLFLNPRGGSALPDEAKGAVFVNYNCGQSRPWADVSRSSLKLLAALESMR